VGDRAKPCAAATSKTPYHPHFPHHQQDPPEALAQVFQPTGRRGAFARLGRRIWRLHQFRARGIAKTGRSWFAVQRTQRTEGTVPREPHQSVLRRLGGPGFQVLGV